MISGICSVCGRVSTLYTCSVCGKSVCGMHYIAEKGICNLCGRGIKFKGDLTEL
ncbi:MAG: orotate phosphoribosyltransferase [Candidatus Hydrothermarchaeales archaeon]